MKKLILSLAAAGTAAMLFIGCSSNGVSSSDVNTLVNGPNSIKGTLTGTMLDNTPYKFDYDYHVTANDGNSYSESWIEDGGNYDGDSILYVWQYFFFDRNGYADYGDNWSASGKYVNLELLIDMKTLKQMPTDYNNRYMRGMWQNITTAGNRFVYALTFRSSNNSGTLDATSLKYDKNTQILSGKLSMVLPDNNTQSNQYGNYKATTLNGDFNIYVPKESFLVTNKGTYYGQVYRKRGK